MNQEEKPHVQVARPITIDRTMIRTSLMNSLMEFLEDNTHEDLPQKIFEIGDVLYLDETKENKTASSKKLAALVCHSTANFTEIKSGKRISVPDLSGSFRNTGLYCHLCAHPLFRRLLRYPLREHGSDHPRVQ